MIQSPSVYKCRCRLLYRGGCRHQVTLSIVVLNMSRVPVGSGLSILSTLSTMSTIVEFCNRVLVVMSTSDLMSTSGLECRTCVREGRVRSVLNAAPYVEQVARSTCRPWEQGAMSTLGLMSNQVWGVEPEAERNGQGQGRHPFRCIYQGAVINAAP